MPLELRDALFRVGRAIRSGRLVFLAQTVLWGEGRGERVRGERCVCGVCAKKGGWWKGGERRREAEEDKVMDEREAQTDNT